MPYYYIESDGQVFLIEKNGKLTFPESKKEFNFEIEEMQKMNVDGKEIIYCVPVLDSHPFGWLHKDKIIGMDSVEPLVRKAVNLALPRIVTGVVLIKKGKILMVKAKRGFNKNKWALPGGFVNYGEHPKEAAERELKEEIGISVKIKRLIDVFSYVFRDTNYHSIAVIYFSDEYKGKIKLKEDEIEEAGWLALKELNPSEFENPTIKTIIEYLQKNGYC